MEDTGSLTRQAKVRTDLFHSSFWRHRRSRSTCFVTGSWMSSLPSSVLPLIGISQSLLQTCLDLKKEGRDSLATKEYHAVISLDDQFQPLIQLQTLRGHPQSPSAENCRGTQDQSYDFTSRYLSGASSAVD